MQIVVNTRLLIKDKLEGIGWFTYQTLKRITLNNPNVHFVFLFDRDFDPAFVFADNVTPLILFPQARHPFLYYTWFQFSVKTVLNRMKPDLFLSPDGFLSLGARCKQLPVIHDINFLHHPGDLKWLTSRYYNHYFPQFAKAATRIATVSAYSRKDIVTEYHVRPEKIDVVYNGINDFFKAIDPALQTTTKIKYTGGNDYFLCVSSLHPRKNIATLIKAFSVFKKESQSPMKLVLAGPAFWGLREIRQVIESLGLAQEVILTGRLPDEELALVMGAALALTFIPYYEGFGIPVIEAMAASIPVITANVTSLPEIAGDAALLVDPFDIHDIKSAMLRVYRDAGLRRSLVDKGNIQKQKFSWDRSADLLWESVLKAVN